MVPNWLYLQWNNLSSPYQYYCLPHFFQLSVPNLLYHIEDWNKNISEFFLPKLICNLFTFPVDGDVFAIIQLYPYLDRQSWQLAQQFL